MPKSDHDHKCDNCQRNAHLGKAVTVQQGGRVVAVLCEDCQQAKKINITLTRKMLNWEFSQYFPVEV